MAILNLIPEGDPDMTTYQNDLLGTNKPEQQSGTFWFPKHKNAGKIEDHTTTQTPNLKKLYELKKKEKLNPKN